MDNYQLFEHRAYRRRLLVEALHDACYFGCPIELPRTIYMMCTDMAYYPEWFAGFCSGFSQDLYVEGFAAYQDIMYDGLSHCSDDDVRSLLLDMAAVFSPDADDFSEQ